MNSWFLYIEPTVHRRCKKIILFLLEISDSLFFNHLTLLSISFLIFLSLPFLCFGVSLRFASLLALTVWKIGVVLAILDDQYGWSTSFCMINLSLGVDGVDDQPLSDQPFYRPLYSFSCGFGDFFFFFFGVCFGFLVVICGCCGWLWWLLVVVSVLIGGSGGGDWV